jgi:hypothetical protein
MGTNLACLDPDLNICYFLPLSCYSKPSAFNIFLYFYFFCKCSRRVTSASRSILRATSASSPFGLDEHPPQSLRFALHGQSHMMRIFPHNLENFQLASIVSSMTYIFSLIASWVLLRLLPCERQFFLHACLARFSVLFVT